jgi:hypothetical protein
MDRDLYDFQDNTRKIVPVTLRRVKLGGYSLVEHCFTRAGGRLGRRISFFLLEALRPPRDRHSAGRSPTNTRSQKRVNPFSEVVYQK